MLQSRRLSHFQSMHLGAAIGLALLLAARPAAAAAPQPGQKAPVFSLKTIDKGDARTLDTLGKGKLATAVVFLSCKCPWVVKARGPLADLVKQYGGKVQFVGVNSNQNESADDIKADAAQNFAFPMLRDEGSKVADLYGAERTPEIFLVDPAGIVRYHGGLDDLGAALGELTAGKPVTKAATKSLGCSIKRKS